MSSIITAASKTERKQLANKNQSSLGGAFLKKCLKPFSLVQSNGLKGKKTKLFRDIFIEASAIIIFRNNSKEK